MTTSNAAPDTEVGVNPAGGIRTTKDAIKYLVLINETVGDDWLIRHRFVSTDWSAPDSTMAR